MAQQKKPSQGDIHEDGFIAAISYISFLFIIPLFLKRKNKLVQSHAKQGLILFIAEIAGMFIVWIPIIGQLIWVAFIVAAVIGISKALKGEEWEIPYIGRYADKFNI